MGNLIIPNGSTALFSAAKDIIVDKNVGATQNTYPVPAGQIQGIYSADRNFTVQGINNCLIGPDNMLNVEGAIITNAAQQGGKFINKRDLCGNNTLYPAFTIKIRPDFILNTPTFLMQQKTLNMEVAP